MSIEPTWKTCEKCRQHGDETLHLIEACSLVAIDSGKSPYEVALAYFTTYHKNGHKELEVSRKA